MRDFNPRTPCGVRLSVCSSSESSKTFQSTHPLRGATLIGRFGRFVLLFQSTHPLRGATMAVDGCGDCFVISIHAPLAGCDSAKYAFSAALELFQSTHPLRGATRTASPVTSGQYISIHAPLAGCDYSKKRRKSHNDNFNPRTPCGVRQAHHLRLPHTHHFNPRTPCGVRPNYLKLYPTRTKFQSTHPLRGATCITEHLQL